jgi:hypothetical protein
LDGRHVLGPGSPPGGGARSIQVIAHDGSGGRHTTDLDIRVDRSPPALRLVSPVRGQTVTSRTVSVLGTVRDESAVTVTLNGVKADRIGGAWRAELSGLEAGPQTLVAVARDEAGNETRVEQNVTVTPSSGPVALEAEGGTLARGVAGPTALTGEGTTVHTTTGRSAPMTALSMAAQSLAGESAAGTVRGVGQVLSDETGSRSREPPSFSPPATGRPRRTTPAATSFPRSWGRWSSRSRRTA